MRLTLRTLLAYLDDTLEPSEAKLIGQKVAESDTAQELIARIREVTRRRRITAPTASGPGAKVDPNTVAEYLDNELSADQLAEVEQLALASDVHLAEIASCHQILTLVLGEPALVPPTAYKRMYGLVKPPESNPARLPPTRREEDAGPHESRDVDETLRLGLPALKVGNWTNRLILAGGAAAVFLLLAFAIWQLLPPALRENEGGNVAKVAPTNRLPSPEPDKKDKIGPKDDGKQTRKDDNKPPDQSKDKDQKDQKDQKDHKDTVDGKDKEKEPEKDKIAKDEGPSPPDPTVKTIGYFDPPAVASNALLLQKKDQDHWVRLLRGKEQAKISSKWPLMSLPGYKSNIVLDTGARLTLWGNIPEQYPISFESVVELHVPDKMDLDLTLQRGRIQISNPGDQPLKARIRFDNPASPKKGEIWDITLLDKGTEVVVMLLTDMPPGEPFYPDRDNTQRMGPVTDVVALATAGKATLKRDLNAAVDLTPPNDGSMYHWNSRQGPQAVPMAKGLPPWLTPATGVDAKIKSGFLKALEVLNNDLLSQSVDASLKRAIFESSDFFKSRLAVRCAAAVDDIQRLKDTLAEQKDREVRWEAKEMLQRWISYKANNEYELFDMLQPGFDKGEAAIFLQLLRYFTPQQRQDPVTYQALIGYLGSRKVPIREVAYYHLWYLVPAGHGIPHNLNAPEAQVRDEVAQWQKLIPEGSLPPPPSK
jgi:hypothetical protein